MRNPVTTMDQMAAVSATLLITIIAWVLIPLLVNAWLYIMGGIAVYYLWRAHVRPGIEVRKFRKELDREETGI